MDDFHEMLEARIASMERYGYKVRTEFIKGYKKPKSISGFLPTATAEKDGRKIILQVETPGFSESSRKKYEAFSNIPDTQLQVVAPKSCLMKIRTIVHGWDAKVTRWWRDTRF